MFTAQLVDYNWPVGLTITVNSYELTDRGGPKAAQLQAQGQDAALWGIIALIGRRLVITNGSGNLVWHGIISKISGAVANNSIAVDLETCYNRIAVEYTAPDAYGASQSYRTDWESNTDSVEQYGARELIFSVGESNTTMAELRRSQLLAAHAWPALTGKGFTTSASTLTIDCVGTAYTLDARYVENTGGRLVNEANGSATMTIGWQLTSTELGFYDGLHDIQARLGALNNGDLFTISGSTSNNVLMQVAAANDDPQVVVTSTQISFGEPDDCYDGNYGFGNLKSPAWVYIGGDTSNADYYLIEQVNDAGSFRISPGAGSAFTNESPNGNNRTVTMGHRVTVTGTVTTEMPGDTVTVTMYGSSLAQRFYVPSSFEAGTMALQLRKVGSPSDGVRVTFYADSGGSIGSSLFSVTLPASSIPISTGPQEIWLDLSAYTFATGYYWFIIDRSGSIDPVNYFQVGITPTTYYTTLAWTGSAWANLNYRDPPTYTQYSIPFKLYDLEDTSTTMQRIVAIYPSEQVTAINVTDTGVLTNQYMVNKRTAYAELVGLLDIGDSGGSRLILNCSKDGTLFVNEADVAAASGNMTLHKDGQLYTYAGAPVDRGVLPVGAWLRLPGIPESLNATWSMSPVYITSARYDVRSGSFDYKTLADDTNAIMFITR